MYSLEYHMNQYCFLTDLLLIPYDTNIVNYANDNIIYKELKNNDGLIVSLQDATAKLFKWFFWNQIKGNIKYWLLMSKDKSSKIYVGESIT